MPIVIRQSAEWRKRMNTPVKKESFIQINIVVADIDKAAKTWSAILGIPVPEIRHSHLQSFGDYKYTYHGEEKPCELYVCNIDMGNFVLELHQPAGGESSFQEFIDKHGNGVHHIGFEVGEDREAVLEGLKELGLDIDRTVGYYPGSSWTIVGADDVLGVNLNIKPRR